MATVQLRSGLFAAAMACVLALPYTAPVVCGVIGKMGSEMEMPAEAGAVVQADAAGTTCCTLNECGLPQVAPLADALEALARVSELRTLLPPSPSTHPTTDRLPPTPPPEV